MPPSRPATIADVAAAAGVGVGTVSRVINGASNVRESTRATVQQAIERLGYRPSHLAAALSRGTPGAVAIVVPHLTSPSVVPRLAGALAVLNEQGYDTVVCNVDTPAQRDHHLAALTGRHRAAGVIVVSLRLSTMQAELFRRGGIPLVAIDMVIPGVPHTVTDNVAGGRMAAGYLLSLGHRKIGFVGDTMRGAAAAGRLLLGFVSSQRRLTGYRQALAAAGAGERPELVRRGPHGPASAEALTAELLALPDPPTAIFAASDTQAIGVLAAADRGGVKVPGELSVMGFDDIESAGLMGLSTIRQQLWDSGAEGARRLCALLRGDRIVPLRQQLPLEVVPRSSTAPAPGTGATLPESGRATASDRAVTGKGSQGAGGHR
jgi:DNA-binding LacI/PurR family transcriptional regulator